MNDDTIAPHRLAAGPGATRRALLSRAALGAGAAAALAGGLARPARAEVAQVRLSHGYGILYLPLIVMRERKLLEAQAEKAGLGRLETSWQSVDGGNVINDAMLAGSLDIAGTGAPGFITLWAKARGIPRAEIIGVSGMSACALPLVTNKPEIKSLADFTSADKIALPGIKTSLAAVVLQMLCAKQFGPDQYAKLDPMTVGLPHPEALAALLSGKTEITAHFGSPPFSYIELANPKIHTVVNAPDVLGDIMLDVVFAPRRFVDANPKTMAAFLAAFDEAVSYIASDKMGAAAIYARASPVKVPESEVVKMIEDPYTKFSATPKGMMQYADFMARVGSIKVKPASWKDLYMPALHDRAGS